MKAIILFFALLLFSQTEAFPGNPAPYTNEAYKRIESIVASNPPEYDANLSKEERLRKGVEYWRNIFHKAGYNYDDTIVKVVNDMRNNPDRFRKGPDPIFIMIYMGLHITMSQCNYDKVDCLQFFPSDAAESIDWLIKNTEFKF